MAAAETFAEFGRVGISEPLRQGDVLERVASDSTPWNRHLLVITADCDLAHGKHHGRVTCVPLLLKGEYLLELQVPRLIEQVVSNVVANLAGALVAAGTAVPSARRLREWPLEADTPQILAELGVVRGEQPMLAAMFDALRSLAKAPESVAAAVDLLVRTQLAVPSPKSEKNLRAAATNTLMAPFKQPPGDALFLSAIADGHDQGYFAYLRHLEQVWQYDVALEPTRSQFAYRRLSRLRDKYIHAVAQRFALVFMSIGLPDSYEEMRDLHAQLLLEEIQ